jgi:2-polyprenyl-3-methyl-5-hydroxy-6-metoxy-1,4-benzoquinol methylase
MDWFSLLESHALAPDSWGEMLTSINPVAGFWINYFSRQSPSGQKLCLMRYEPACEIPDLGPEVYARWRASKIGATTERLERQLILELIGNIAGRRVLDVGCGDGEFAVELAKRGAIVTGIDVSAAMIDAARSRARQKNADVAFQVAIAEELPFPAEQFDAVTAITILCFVDDATPVFREIAGCCDPRASRHRRATVEQGGRASHRAARLAALAAWPVPTASELRNLAKQAGLDVKTVRGAIYYPRWRFATRLLSPFDPSLSRLTTIGAGFVALSAVKPGSDGPQQ